MPAARDAISSTSSAGSRRSWATNRSAAWAAAVWLTAALAARGDAIWDPTEPPLPGPATARSDGSEGSNVTAQLLLRPETPDASDNPELRAVDRVLLGPRPAEARSALGALRAREPDEPRVMRRSAVAAFLAGDYAEAASQFAAWQRRRPDSPEAAAGLCAALLHEGRIEEAAAAIASPASRHPKHLLVQYQAALLRSAGFTQAREGDWQPHRLTLPEAAIVANLLASDRADLERVLSPEIFVKACSALLGEGTDLQLARISESLTDGATALQQGRWQQARKALGRAVSSGVVTMGVRLELARSLFECGETDLAAAEFSWLARDYPSDGPILYNYGYVLLKTGDYDAAAETFRRALHAMPGNGQTRFAFACALAGAGRRDEAWAVLEPLALERPEDLAPWLKGEQPYLKALRADPRVAALAAGRP